MPKPRPKANKRDVEPAEPGLPRIEWWQRRIEAAWDRGETAIVPRKMAAIIGLARAVNRRGRKKGDVTYE